MFENIHFSVYNTKETLTGANYKRLRPDDGPEQDFAIKGSLFAISGSIRSIPAVPVSRHTMEHSYYVQTFSVMISDEKYFTRRKNCDSFLILYTYEGEGKLEYEGKTYHLGKGDGFMIDCRRLHDYRTVGEKWVHSDLHFKGAPMMPLYEEFLSSSSPVFTEPVTGTYQNYLEKLAALLSVFSPYRELQLSNLLSNIVTHILVASAEHPEGERAMPLNLKYLVQYMENHYFRSLSLDFLASFSGLSKYHLTREFSRYMGCPPIEYLIRLRTQNARFLLQNTELPVKQIAAEVGMESVSNFVQTFKKRTGMTPGEYRQQFLIL